MNTTDRTQESAPRALTLRIDDTSLRAHIGRVKGSVAPIDPFYKEITLSAAEDKWLEKLEEAIYDTPELLGDFASVAIIVDTADFTLIPLEAESQAQLLFDMAVVGSEMMDRVMCPIYPSNTLLVMGLRHEFARFLRRTFPDAKIYHPLQLLGEYFGARFTAGGNGKRLYATLHKENAYLAVFDRKNLRGSVRREVKDPMDAVYYIISMLNSLQMNLMEDEVFVAGETSSRNSVMKILRDYIVHVMPVIVTESLETLPQDAPFDMKIIRLCES